MNETLKKQLDKVAKLLALEKDALDKGSLAEAANAAQRAQEILLKYNLSKDQISQEKDKPVDSIVFDLRKLRWNHRHGTWIFSLASTVAKVNFSRIVIQGGSRGNIYIIGKESDREITLFMMESLVNRLRGMQTEAWRVYQGYEKEGTFRRGYYLGATAAITKRLKETLDNTVSETPGAMAIVLSKGEEVQRYMNIKFPDLGKGKKSSISGAEGFSNGYKDGKNIALNKGIGNTALNQKMIG